MPEAAQNYCNYLLKILSTCLAVAGLILSWNASQTCEFISFLDEDGNPPDGAEDPPFNRAIAANVGIFRYEITQLDNGAGESGCLPYGLRFSDQQDYPSLGTAQFCAVIGPCFAVVGAFLTLVECFVCNVSGSFMVASLFLLVGSGVQAGVFVVVADPVFCFEGSELECKQGKGVYFAACAAVLFLLAACFHCVAPRPDPFCFNFGQALRRESKRAATPSEQGATITRTDDTHYESETLDEGAYETKKRDESTNKKEKRQTGK